MNQSDQLLLVVEVAVAVRAPRIQASGFLGVLPAAASVDADTRILGDGQRAARVEDLDVDGALLLI